MLWSCLHFPTLALQVFLRAVAAPGPLIVVSADKRPQVIACETQAARLGIRSGMALAAALALVPHTAVQVRDESAEAQALSGIAAWGGQFASAISLAPRGCVLLEIGGSLKLFGGAERLLRSIGAGVRSLGYSTTMAVAPTPGAALLLARAGIETPVEQCGDLRIRLSPLPLTLLDYSGAALDTLSDIGIATIGDCLELPRDGLARRFGPGLLDEIDRALGNIPDPRAPFIVPETFAGRLELPSPVWEAQAVLFAARRLTSELTGALAGRGLGAMTVELELIHEDFPPTPISIRLSAPSRDADHLLMLLRERLAQTQLPDRVEAIRLSAAETAVLPARDRALFAGDNSVEPFALIERLCARLGDAAVCALHSYPDHRPELAWRKALPGAAQRAAAAPPRPLWLLPEPEPVEQSMPAQPLVLMDGPERIESGWWDDNDVRRDYFVARGAGGAMLWVFRDTLAEGQWYLHGIFA